MASDERSEYLPARDPDRPDPWIDPAWIDPITPGNGHEPKKPEKPDWWPFPKTDPAKRPPKETVD